MDLRQIGIPFEKKFIQFSDDDIKRITSTYHQRQVTTLSGLDEAPASSYENIAEFCYSATLDEISKKDYSLVPSKYIEFINRDVNINFKEKMNALTSEFAELMQAEEQSKRELLSVFKALGYEIDL
jgi:type I restriction enzyme M protein